jgi:hypothetical protein
VGEECDCVCDEPVGLPGFNAAGCDERGDALYGGQQEQADPVGVAWLQLARLLPLTDQVVERGEQTAKRVLQCRGVLAALDGVHQFEEGGVLRREAYVGGRGRPQLRLVVVSGGLDRRAQLVAQAQESGFGGLPA